MIILAIIVRVIIGIAVFMTFAAVTVASAGALFLDTGFVDGWHAAWNRPGILFLFAFVVSLVLGSKVQSKTNTTNARRR